MVYENLIYNEKDGVGIEINHFALVAASSDSREGMRAFLEKRKADFNGKLND